MLLIKNADVVYTMEGPPLNNADILIKDGKIAAVGQGLAAGDAEILDAAGLVALPGLVDAHTHHGGFGMTNPGDQDLNEMTEAATPQVQAVHAVDIFDRSFRHAAKCGVTSMCILPGSGNVVGGLAFATKTSGESLSQMVIKNPCAMKVAFGINPKNFHGAKGRAPMTRMGIAAILRTALREAQEYLHKKEAAADDPDKRPAYNAKHEAFIPVLKGEIPLKMHCEQFDMLTAIGIARAFGCRYMIEHAWASEHFYDELAAGGGAVNYGPVGVVAGYGELTGANIYEVIELDRRGLCVSVITDGPIYSEDVLVMQAGDAVRWGMDHQRALRMITLNPAVAMEIDGRVGSLKACKDGDVALFKGVPALDVNAAVACTVQDGQIVYRA